MFVSRKVYGAFRSIYLFFVISTPLFVLTESCEASSEKVSRLVARAAELRLSKSRDWEVLLHYKPVPAGRVSLVDDPRFFLAANGKQDPDSELVATVTAFFSPAEMGNEHALCRFPARAVWLKKSLELANGELPEPVCSKLDETMKAIDPRSAVLVFPAAHNNGPASMFGHTLIKIGSSYSSELLSHAVNYAAQANDTNGLLYAFKGIFGLYPGYYSILPYYEKLKEYGDLEHRDVWEYQLNLAPDEVKQMALHIWELKDIYSDYYFFDENCSFNLLFLLEVARPELKLAEDYWNRSAFWVIPADTIATVRNAGLVKGVNYRPSQATRINHRASLLPENARILAYQAGMGLKAADDQEFAGLKPETGRQTLDLAAEYIQLRYSRRDLPVETFKSAFLPLLAARSRLGAGELDAGKVPKPQPPEDGHFPAKIRIGAGVRQGESFSQFSWQPAYHDLMDAEAGYTKGAQINFMSLSGRYLPERNSFQLQSLRPVEIISLAPRNLFFQPVSWKVNGGVERRLMADGSDRLLFNLNSGGGLAWEVARNGILYSFAEAELQLSDRYADKSALGGGLSAGFLWQPAAVWTLHLQAKGFAYLMEEHREYRLGIDQQFHLGRSGALAVRASVEKSFGIERNEAFVEWIHFY